MLKKLFNYQQTALDLAIGNNRFLLALDMGLGKTLISYYWLKNVLQNTNYNTLIVVNAQKLNDWKKEGNPFGFKEIILVKTPNAVAKLTNVKPTQKCVFIISYEKLRSIASKNKRFLNQSWILILDESQAIKSPTSQRTKLFLEHNHNFKKVLLLSGDPISTGYHNLYAQMRLLNIFDNNYSYLKFSNDYLIFKKVTTIPVPILTGYKNVDKLLNLLKSKSYFLKTNDAIELPQTRHFIRKTSVDNNYTNLIINNGIINKDFSILADNTMSLFHYSRMVASGVIKDDKQQYHLLNNAKLKEFEMLLDESNFNFSVFYNYNVELHFLKQSLENKKIKYFEINGAKNELELAKSTAKNNRVVVLINYGSGAKGIDGLQNFIFNQIYFSPTWSGELHKQSLKRIHRIGQNQKVNYYYLIASDSIETKIYRALKKSENYTYEMFKHDFRLTTNLSAKKEATACNIKRGWL